MRIKFVLLRCLEEGAWPKRFSSPADFAFIRRCENQLEALTWHNLKTKSVESLEGAGTSCWANLVDRELGGRLSEKVRKP